jgi:GSH-dependent disulfide-bond oxidoreductase
MNFRMTQAHACGASVRSNSRLGFGKTASRAELYCWYQILKLLARCCTLLAAQHLISLESLKMIDLYTWGTPNGRKVSIMLEECGLAYKVHKIDISKNEQFSAEFLTHSPNGKIPAIFDPNGPEGESISLFESGAILVYLAGKTGKFLPKKVRAKYEVMQWLMFQMAGVGPMFGQTHHFMRAAPVEVPYGVDRYHKETKRLYGVMDKRLASAPFLASDYSIADMATFPWVARHEWHKVDLNEFPNVKRWFDIVGAREAVQRGMAVPS